jgi:FtsZ-binding cell division protein ZapB
MVSPYSMGLLKEARKKVNHELVETKKAKEALEQQIAKFQKNLDGVTDKLRSLLEQRKAIDEDIGPEGG